MATEVAAHKHKHKTNININWFRSLSLCIVILLTYFACASSSSKARDSYNDEYNQDDYDPDAPDPDDYYDEASEAPGPAPIASRTWSSARTAAGAVRERDRARGRHDHSADVAENEYNSFGYAKRKSPRRRISAAHLSGQKPRDHTRDGYYDSGFCKRKATLHICDNVDKCYGQFSSPLDPNDHRKRPWDNRIKGGLGQNAELFPPFVTLWVSGRQTCGGVMIGRQHVLTSAQCVPSDAFTYVRGYRPSLAHTAVTQDMGWFDPPFWCKPKEYSAVNLGVTTLIRHDWAIGKLNYSQEYYGTLPNIACIPYKERDYFESTGKTVIEGYDSPESPYQNLECYAMGTGWYEPGQSEPLDREFRAFRVKPVDCGVRFYGFDHWRGVCFKSENPNDGVCNFDIGGPVLCRYPNNDLWWVMGILSSFYPSTCTGSFWTTHVPNFAKNIFDQCF